MSKSLNHITIATYAHPELYPPILSAVHQLSRNSSGIDILTRNTLHSQWAYPSNVSVNFINKNQYDGFNIETISTYQKLQHFFKYVIMLKRILKKNDSKILIVHDVIPLFAAFLIKGFLKRNNVKLWYHNHDVTDISKAGNFSLMGIASKFEEKAFESIDIFTLPSKERLQYFPIDKLKNKPIIIPNYPLEGFYGKVHSIKSNEQSQNRKTIKLVFQGSIGKGHGLEEIIGVLDKAVNEKELQLHLVGKIRDAYLNELKSLVAEKGVGARFTYHGMQNFTKLPTILSQYDIGIAIHKPYNVTYSTGGTASNKIYEYAACRMPILLFDNEHYRGYLENRKWTFFTDLSSDSLLEQIKLMDDNLEKFSENAYEDFRNEFNFEKIFSERMDSTLSKLD